MTKVWLITGCSTGFGKEIAKYAIEKGDSVIATARNPDKIDVEGDVLKLKLDVTSKEDIKKAIEEGKAWKGKIDVLVNNAGFGNMGSIEETPDDTWKKLYDVNVFGLLDVTKEVLPVMKEQKSGHIINMSSIGGLLSMPGFGPYCSTKFAVEGISEALMAEVAPLGIKVTVIEPGAFKTNFIDNVAQSSYSEEYNGTVGETDEMLKGLDGNQAGDPAKAAKAIYDVIQMDKPPMRLLLGNDAYEWGLPKIESMVSEIKANEQVTRSTDFG